MLISWTAEYDGGSTLTAYAIYILHSDGISYSQDLVNCDGSTSLILTNLQCSVPISTLRSTPYSLPWGSSIQVKLTTTNAVGTSDYSLVGNGAIILTNPDRPVNLQNNPAETSSNQVGIQWEDGSADGGSPVIDYRVSYD